MKTNESKRRTSSLTKIATLVPLVMTITLSQGCRQEQATEDVSPSVEYVVKQDTLSEWQLLQMAIIMTESEFKPDALGRDNDAGLYQMIPIYVAEVNRLSGSSFTHEDAFDIEKSMQMFDIYQSFKNPEHDVDLAIYYHNKASWYRRKVLENYDFVKRYEAVRGKLCE